MVDLRTKIMHFGMKYLIFTARCAGPTPILPILLALCCGLLISCDGVVTPPQEPSAENRAGLEQTVERTETRKMHAFMDEVYERNVAARPEWETSLGRKTDRQGEWNDRSDA
jgi:hypothetical protein